MSKKEKEVKKTFQEDVLDVLKRVPLSRQEKEGIAGKIEKLAKKHFAPQTEPDDNPAETEEPDQDEEAKE